MSPPFAGVPSGDHSLPKKSTFRRGLTAGLTAPVRRRSTVRLVPSSSPSFLRGRNRDCPKSAQDFNTVINSIDSLNVSYRGLRKLFHKKTWQMARNDEHSVRETAFQTSQGVVRTGTVDFLRGVGWRLAHVFAPGPSFADLVHLNLSAGRSVQVIWKKLATLIRKTE